MNTISVSAALLGLALATMGIAAGAGTAFAAPLTIPSGAAVPIQPCVPLTDGARPDVVCLTSLAS